MNYGKLVEKCPKKWKFYTFFSPFLYEKDNLKLVDNKGVDVVLDICC